MKRNRIAWIGLALIVVIAGGFLYLTLSAASADSNREQLAGETEIQGAVARSTTDSIDCTVKIICAVNDCFNRIAKGKLLMIVSMKAYFFSLYGFFVSLD